LQVKVRKIHGLWGTGGRLGGCGAQGVPGTYAGGIIVSGWQRPAAGLWAGFWKHESADSSSCASVCSRFQRMHCCARRAPVAFFFCDPAWSRKTGQDTQHTLQHMATDCNTLDTHTATHYNTLFEGAWEGCAL